MNNKIKRVFQRSLRFAEKKDYKGFDPYDALNSPILSRIGKSSKVLRILFTHIVKDIPFNIRPAVGIEPSRNPKGIALFALSYYNLNNSFDDRSYKTKAEKLAKWLVENRIQKNDMVYWGYNFPWQSGRSFLPKYGPCAVVTYFAAEAVKNVLGDKSILEGVADFYLRDLNRLIDNDKYLCLSYTPFEKVKIVNHNALIAHQLAEFAEIFEKDTYLHDAKRIVNWVISQQDTDGGWFYSPSSHLKKDNFHNGYVLWALMKYWKLAKDQDVLESIKKGLKFHRSLFENDGMPIFSNEKKYPIDIHNCSQGIITFKEAERLDLHQERFYDKILDWTLENMWDYEKHYFYYQKHRLWTNKIPYMRWSQAWMAYALSELLLND